MSNIGSFKDYCAGTKNVITEVWNDPKKRTAAAGLMFATGLIPGASVALGVLNVASGINTIMEADKELKEATTEEEKAAATQKFGKGVMTMATAPAAADSGGLMIFKCFAFADKYCKTDSSKEGETLDLQC